MALLRKSDLWVFWRLSRPLNVLIAGLTFGFSAYVSALRSPVFLSDGLFWAELAILTLLMAGGYWINDVYDFKIDLINKPQRTCVGVYISRKKVVSYYLLSLALAAGLCVLLPYKFWIVNGAAALTLWVYAWYFKREAVVGNLLVAGLTALVVLAAGLLYHIKWPIVWGMVFAFGATFCREVVKDVEDMKGDLQSRLRTLPLLVGIRVSKWVISVWAALLMAAVYLPVATERYLYGWWNWPYALAVSLSVVAPLGLMLVWVRRASRPSHFRRPSTLLKAILLTGLLCLLLLHE